MYYRPDPPPIREVAAKEFDSEEYRRDLEKHVITELKNKGSVTTISPMLHGLIETNYKSSRELTAFDNAVNALMKFMTDKDAAKQFVIGFEVTQKQRLDHYHEQGEYKKQSKIEVRDNWNDEYKETYAKARQERYNRNWGNKVAEKTEKIEAEKSPQEKIQILTTKQRLRGSELIEKARNGTMTEKERSEYYWLNEASQGALAEYREYYDTIYEKPKTHLFVDYSRGEKEQKVKKPVQCVDTEGGETIIRREGVLETLAKAFGFMKR